MLKKFLYIQMIILQFFLFEFSSYIYARMSKALFGVYKNLFLFVGLQLKIVLFNHHWGGKASGENSILIQTLLNYRRGLDVYIGPVLNSIISGFLTSFFLTNLFFFVLLLKFNSSLSYSLVKKYKKSLY